LRDSGENINEIAVITKIIGSLPDKYRSFRQAWLSVDESRQTVTNLTARLLDEEASMTAINEEGKALVTTKENPVKKKKIFKCFNCNKKGHFAKDCRAPKKDTRKEKKDSENKGTAFTCMMPSDSEDMWILDSGASAHMCYKREFFAELNQCEEFSVTLGNNKELSVTGKGIILINTLVNNQWINSRLTNVWYVPELKKNLFAEGILTKKNMKIIKEGDSAKVYEN